MSPDHRVIAELSDDDATHPRLLLRDASTGEQVGPPLAADRVSR